MNIFLPKYKDLFIPVKTSVKLRGEVRLVLQTQDGRVIRDTGWNDNTVTTTGLDNIANNNLSAWFGIGTTLTPLAVISRTDTSYSFSNASQGGSLLTKYYYKTTYARFGAGVGTGVVERAWIGYNAAAVDCVHTITPSINKLDEQVLDVYHRMYVYPDHSDQVGSVTIDGITYDTLTRSEDINATSYIGWHSLTRAIHGEIYGSTGYNFSYAYDGNIGAIDGKPSGDSAGMGATSYDPYIGLSHVKVKHVDCDLDQGNPALGIRSISWPGWPCRMQTQFDNASDGSRIPKDNTKVIWFEGTCSWST